MKHKILTGIIGVAAMLFGLVVIAPAASAHAYTDNTPCGASYSWQGSSFAIGSIGGSGNGSVLSIFEQTSNPDNYCVLSYSQGTTHGVLHYMSVSAKANGVATYTTDGNNYSHYAGAVYVSAAHCIDAQHSVTWNGGINYSSGWNCFHGLNT